MKRLPTKPGAEKRRFTPDVVRTYAPEAPAELMAFLIASMPDQKRTTVKEMLKYGQVMVNGQVQKQFNLPLQPGDEVKVNFTRPFVVFYNRRLQLVYEDDDIIVINKGYGLLSMGTDKIKEGTAYSIVREYLKTKDPSNKLFIVHRLDQQTSGLMVFARTPEAKEALQHNWNNMVLERTYEAVTEGTPDPAEGEVRGYLAENAAHEVYTTDDPRKGKLAVTRYRTLQSRGKYALVELSLHTVRKNQIREHMQQLGTPISGDRRYGGTASPIHRLALHAQTLRFIHPITRRDMNFTSALPPGFAKLL